MKLSRNFLNEYIDIEKINYHELADKMTNVGNEYDSIITLVDATNLTIGEVTSCINHPDSDHLHICKVNIGDRILDIVCGAPNVRVGLKVIVALPGAKLGDITIKEGVIRGVPSNGMLCSLAELGIEKKYLSEKDIEGIHELDDSAPIGTDPIEYLNLKDMIIDFELTSNRGDLLSIIGMAHEVGAIYNLPVKEIETNYKETKEENNFNLKIETPKCSLFIAKKVKNIKIKPSPDFMQKRLIASGIRPINNIVDISNYVMLETGQPMHFYDLDNLGNTLIVRQAEKDEKLTTLDNQERLLDEQDIVIANEKEAVALAGVMGGLSTEVESTTKNLLLESAIFDGISVRLTSKKILRSESSNRFEKGLDYTRTYLAINRACHLLEKYADAEIMSDEKIYDTIIKKDNTINITVDDINNLLGLKIEKEEIIDIYKRLGFTVEEENNNLKVTVPSRRIDISIKEDLVEEVSRMYGLENLVGTLPKLPTKKGTYNRLNRNIRVILSKLGYNETLSYTLIPNSEVHKYTLDEFEEINLLDPMSDDRKTLRYSLIPSMMMIYDYNAKRNNKNIRIFEIAKSFGKINGKYTETNKLVCLETGIISHGLQKEKVDFFTLKGTLETLLDNLGYNNRYSLTIKELPNEFHPTSSAVINLSGMDIGYIGKIHPNITKDDIYVFEINLDKLKTIHAKNLQFAEISKFPSIEKDLAFQVENNITNENLQKEIKKIGGKYLTKVELFDIYQGDKIEENTKSLAYKLTFTDPQNTLTDEIIMPIFENIISGIEKKFNAKLRNN